MQTSIENENIFKKLKNGNYFVDSLPLFGCCLKENNCISTSSKNETAFLFVSVLCALACPCHGMERYLLSALDASVFGFFSSFMSKQYKRQKQCFAVTSFILVTIEVTFLLRSHDRRT